MQIIWIDWVVVAVVLYYIYEGWGKGLINQVLELGGFLGSLWIALKGYAVLGEFLAEKFGVASGWSKLLGFVGLAILSEAIISEILVWIYAKIPERLLKTKWNKWLGAFPSAFNGMVVVSFLSLLALGLPIRGTVKKDIRASKVGSVLVRNAEKVENNARSIFEEALSETAKFFTINPGSSETIRLDYEIVEKELTADVQSEAKMLELLNAERAKVGAKPVRVDPKIVEVARNHSRDMWTRHFFAHVNPDGKDPFDRMREGGITFSAAGENLALAPTVASAHDGLMKSEGHKRNILDPEFGRVGIGVIDGGMYGKMFTQDFAN